MRYMELLEMLVGQKPNSAFESNTNLQNVPMCTEIKAESGRLMGRINISDNHDGEIVNHVAIGEELHEEAFVIYNNLDQNAEAFNIILLHLRNLDRTCD